MNQFGIEWTERQDGSGFEAKHEGAELSISRGRGRAWKFSVAAPDWKARGEVSLLSDAMRFCALLLGTEA